MREFWRRVTGPKRGVYSLRRAQSAHRNASTNPYSPSDSASLPFLCAFFCNARAQKCLDLCSTVENCQRDAKNGGVAWG